MIECVVIRRVIGQGKRKIQLDEYDRLKRIARKKNPQHSYLKVGSPVKHGLKIQLPSPTEPYPTWVGKPMQEDGLGPPSEPIPCRCLHCGGHFSSAEMVFTDRLQSGFYWFCPIPGCSGAIYAADNPFVG